MLVAWILSDPEDRGSTFLRNAIPQKTDLLKWTKNLNWAMLPIIKLRIYCLAVKSWMWLPQHHAINMYEGVNIKLQHWMEWPASRSSRFTLRKHTSYPLGRRLGGPLQPVWTLWRRNILFLGEIKTRFIGRRSLAGNDNSVLLWTEFSTLRDEQRLGVPGENLMRIFGPKGRNQHRTVRSA
jgi:hypothetical protein